MSRKPRNRSSISFDNLSKSTRLVAPFNKKPNIQYGHIKDFMMYASKEEIYDILLEVGKQIEEYRGI